MKVVKKIICRYLTNSDYYNMYKPRGSEDKGGGQTYIDFPIRSGVTLEEWNSFFSAVCDIDESNQNRWIVSVNSIGVRDFQTMTVYQRRLSTVSIAAQRLGSRNANRIFSWHPENGFPEPSDPSDRNLKPENLAVFLVTTYDDDLWAGWALNRVPAQDMEATGKINLVFPSSLERDGYTTYTEFNYGELFLDEGNPEAPFYCYQGNARFISLEKEDELVTDEFFDDDSLQFPESQSEKREVLQEVRRRNTKAVKRLKDLYQGNCQLTGAEFTFRKRDGSIYSEAHHLIPLGEEGADSPHNIVIVSPLVHRMLHYADVAHIDLARITSDNTLDVLINGKIYTITWHPLHAKTVREAHVIGE